MYLNKEKEIPTSLHFIHLELLLSVQTTLIHDKL